jgi:hypothetical protein
MSRSLSKPKTPNGADVLRCGCLLLPACCCLPGAAPRPGALLACTPEAPRTRPCPRPRAHAHAPRSASTWAMGQMTTTTTSSPGRRSSRPTPRRRGGARCMTASPSLLPDMWAAAGTRHCAHTLSNNVRGCNPPPQCFDFATNPIAMNWRFWPSGIRRTGWGCTCRDEKTSGRPAGPSRIWRTCEAPVPNRAVSETAVSEPRTPRLGPKLTNTHEAWCGAHSHVLSS